MSRRRDPLPRTLLVAGLAALTGWLTLLSWRVLVVEWMSFAVPALLLAVVVATTGAVLRWSGLPALVAIPVQLLVAGCAVLGLVTGLPAPTPASIAAMAEAVDAALTSARTYVAPLPPAVPPVEPLLLAGAAIVLVAVDVAAGAARRVSVAGLVLLGVYTVPIGIVGSAGSWWSFAAATGVFLCVLFLQHDEALGRWGRVTGEQDVDDPSAFGVRTGAVRGSAASLGAGAIALAVVLPWVVPTMELRLFDGVGAGDGEITVGDPTIDLRRDLQRTEDVPLVYVTTSDPDPSYLRIAALNNFDDGYWSPGDRDIPTDQVAQGQMPALLGVSPSVDRTTYDYRVRTASAFDWSWLPTMAPITQIAADGDWRYDVATMDFIAGDDDLTAAGVSYTMRGVDLALDSDDMDDAVSGGSAVDPVFTELPGDLPSEVRGLAAEITGGAPTRFRKAVALQSWFRSNYEYDLGQAESAGRSYADLLAFLDEEDRRGYCEQFAASMAIMARTLDIPSRVAIGFLSPSQSTSPGVWEYSSDDLHAWPELFFPGSGWVRFEPTPGDRAGTVPPWTDVQAEQEPSEPTTGPSPGRADEPVPERGQQPTDTPEPTPDGETDAGFPWGWAALALLGLVLVSAIALLPRTLRRARRSRRLGDGTVESAWLELRDTLVDLGHGWPEGRSPRAVGRWVAARFGAAGADAERPRRGRDQDPEAGDAVDRLVHAVERDRYAREAGPVDRDVVHDDVLTVEEALRRGVPTRTRRRADWWPGSVTSWRGPRARQLWGRRGRGAETTTPRADDSLRETERIGS